jgi:hypothetical protein
MPTERRLVFSRLGQAVVGGVLAVVALGVVGLSVCDGMVRWLHGRPQYQTTFKAIALDPPPPAWYRGGAAAFLDQVRRSAQREDVPFSALDVDLAELRREFRLSCWVKRVGRIRRRSPNRLYVPLEYRVPVARVDTTGARDWVALDVEGVILPFADVEEETARTLIPIYEIGTPYDPRPGDVWKSHNPAEGVGEASARAVAAARLAAYLKSVLGPESKPSASGLRPVAIHSIGTNALFLEIGQETMVYWAEAPGDEAPNRPTAGEKWAMLSRWLPQSPASPIQKPYYLAFTKEKVVVRKEQERN